MPVAGGASLPHDALTYEPFFGLAEKPFALEADPKFIYDSPAYAAARRSLLAGIRRREGLQVLTGEIGTGKTTLCRTVLRDLGRHTYSSLVPDPFASREDLLKMLLVDFGVLSIEELTSGHLRQASRTELGFLLGGFLNSMARDAFAVGIIDEAQNLSLPLIEETRILFETFGARGRLQLVLVGQPELHAKLKLPEMRQVDQRVCGYHRLGPLPAEAIDGYIQHRLHAAGARGDGALFPPAIVAALHRRSGGVPRLINRVCDRALQLAFEREVDRVDQAILDAALADVGATTLSPTWDAIVFAQPPAAAPPAAPAAPPVAAAPVTPVAEPDDFEREIRDWVKGDLQTATREATPVEGLEDLPPVRRSVPRTQAKKDAAGRVVVTDWPRHVTPETYMQKLMRIWMKRAAIAFAGFVTLNILIAAGSLLLNAQTPAEPAAPPSTPVPAAPAKDVPNTAAPQPVAAESTSTAAPVTVVPAASAPAPVASVAPVAPPLAAPRGGVLVAVGVFANRESADRLVETLAQAGLPAMQRPSRLGSRELQQVVLGPFSTRTDAATALRRLQSLGGHNDARIISQ